MDKNQSKRFSNKDSSKSGYQDKTIINEKAKPYTDYCVVKIFQIVLLSPDSQDRKKMITQTFVVHEKLLYPINLNVMQLIVDSIESYMRSHFIGIKLDPIC